MVRKGGERKKKAKMKREMSKGEKSMFVYVKQVNWQTGNERRNATCIDMEENNEHEIG